jgi:hypothetical protein
MLRSFAVFAFLGFVIAPAAAQDAPRASECLAMANAPPRSMLMRRRPDKA